MTTPSTSDLRTAAERRYQTDVIAHVRADLAVRVADVEVGLIEVPVANDDGTVGTGRVRVLDDLELVRLGAVLALELAAQAAVPPLGEDDRELTAREVAETQLAGILAAAGAPRPADLTKTVLERIEARGVAFVRVPR